MPFAPFLNHASHAGKWEGFAKDAAIITMGELPFAPFLNHASYAGKWEGFAKDAAIITMGEWQFALTFPYVLNFPYLCRRYAN